MNIPRIVIGGVASGVGKTTIAVGLARALRERGLKVAVFKCGPDYLDPTYHTLAAGSRCHNLDGWMMGRDAVLATFENASRGHDIALIEGVMGLFDGATATSEVGSSAEIAKWLGAPVLLVCDAAGMARSVAALVHGFADFDRELRVAGVICNRVGSRSHLELLTKALRATPVVGGLPKQPGLAFPERHLGLHSAEHDPASETRIAAWAGHVREYCDLDAILALARSAAASEAAPPSATGAGTPARAVAASERALAAPAGQAMPSAPSAPPSEPLQVPASAPDPQPSGQARAATAARAPAAHPSVRCRIGIAWDRAFQFYYDDNLRRLEALGAELVRFSPLDDARLPNVDGLYLGGGYPELHAAALEANQAMREAVLDFSHSGAPIYAECGGLMYLCSAIRTLSGAQHAMAGVVPGLVQMRDKLQALGYVEVETQAPTLLGAPGLRFRGHQFRYSELELTGAVDHVYTMRRRRGGEVTREGFAVGQTLASYVHAHWASNPLAASGLVEACARWSTR